jgi:hypothetical protein
MAMARARARRTGIWVHAMLDTVDIARSQILGCHTRYQSSLRTFLKIDVALRSHFVYTLYCDFYLKPEIFGDNKTHLIENLISHILRQMK